MKSNNGGLPAHSAYSVKQFFSAVTDQSGGSPPLLINYELITFLKLAYKIIWWQMTDDTKKACGFELTTFKLVSKTSKKIEFESKVANFNN